MTKLQIKKFVPLQIENVTTGKEKSFTGLLKGISKRIESIFSDIKSYVTSKGEKVDRYERFKKFLKIFDTDITVVQIFINGLIFLFIFGAIIILIRRPINFPSEQMAKVFYVWNGRNTSLTYMTISIWVMVIFSIIWKMFNKKVQGTLRQSRGETL